jgi:hypothetical protein
VSSGPEQDADLRAWLEDLPRAVLRGDDGLLDRYAFAVF